MAYWHSQHTSKRKRLAVYFQKQKCERRKLQKKNEKKKSEYGMAEKYGLFRVREKISMKLRSLGQINIFEQKLHDVSHIDI